MPNLPRPVAHELAPNQWEGMPGPKLKYRCLGCGTVYAVRTRQLSCRLPTILQIDEYARLIGSGYASQVDKLLDVHLKKLHWIKWQRESSITDWKLWKLWKEKLAAEPVAGLPEPRPSRAPKAEQPPKERTNGQFLTKAMKRRKAMGLPAMRQPGEPLDRTIALQQAKAASHKEA